MSSSGRMALLIVCVGCATPAPSPVSSPVSPALPAVTAPVADVPAPAVAVPVATGAKPRSLLEQLDRVELTSIAVVEAEGCAGGDARQWIVSALDAHNEGATCLGDGVGAPSCVMFAGANPDHLRQLMCEHRDRARPVAMPAWAPDILASMHAVPAEQMWLVTSIQDSVRPAIAMQIDDALFVAIHTDAGWRRSDEPVNRMLRLAASRVLDTTALTGTPSFGAITSSYDGGSESGTETTTLTVLEPSASGLAAKASIQTGQFTWLLAADQRRRSPNAATSLDARPHVEVQLVPELGPGVLVLRVQRQTIAKQLAGRCIRAEEDISPPCILVDMKAKAGRYRLVDGELVRAP